MLLTTTPSHTMLFRYASCLCLKALPPALFLAFFITQSVLAQTQTLRGTVVDEQGRALPGASVLISALGIIVLGVALACWYGVKKQGKHVVIATRKVARVTDRFFSTATGRRVDLRGY